MNPIDIFKATMPFIRIKLLIESVFVLFKVFIVALAVWGITGMHYEGFVFRFDTHYRNFVITAAVMGIAVYPLMTLVIRKYIAYMVRVGHIATITRIIKSGKIPRNQIRYGYRQVKKNFLRANVFFVLNRLVHKAVVELQAFVQNLLGGLGIVAALAVMFKKSLINYIDECCLGITFLRPDIKPFTGAIIGVCVYIQSWRAMARQAVRVSLEAFAVTLVFYVAGGVWLYISVTSRNIASIVLSLVLIFVGNAIKKSVLDSYIMVNMLTVFFNESKKIPNIQESKPIIERASVISPGFCNLVYHANETEPFLNEDEQLAILNNRRVGMALGATTNMRSR